MRLVQVMTVITALLTPAAGGAADYPAPKQGQWIAKDFKFHTGETMPELRLAYTTVGEPTGEPVLLLHGTGGSAASFLTPAFAGEMFGAGQPLDATKFFIVIPDSVGHGRSSKPSDGLRSKFPKYNYEDMVDAQHRLLTEGLNIRRVRAVIGSSMGGMHAWIFGVKYPHFMDALVPMASQPTKMSGRNWMLRRLMLETVRNDPDYNGGNYTSPLRSTKLANIFYSVATSGGTLAWQDMAPNRDKADRLVDDRLKAPFATDANDFLYQWESSGDYNPAPGLEKIEAPVLAINAADDERNPPETGLTEAAMKRIKNARLLLIPASKDTRGHGTTGNTAFWRTQFQEFLQSVPRKTM